MCSFLLCGRRLLLRGTWSLRAACTPPRLCPRGLLTRNSQVLFTWSMVCRRVMWSGPGRDGHATPCINVLARLVVQKIIMDLYLVHSYRLQPAYKCDTCVIDYTQNPLNQTTTDKVTPRYSCPPSCFQPQSATTFSTVHPPSCSSRSPPPAPPLPHPSSFLSSKACLFSNLTAFALSLSALILGPRTSPCTNRVCSSTMWSMPTCGA